jgi:hypothetical protein
MLQLYVNGNAAQQKPQNPDKGAIFYTALASNAQLSNDHVHDGVKANFNPVTTQSIASGSWVAAPIGGGVYSQVVTMPAGMTCAAFNISFLLATGAPIFLTFVPASSNTYTVYINDNTQTITAVYTS